VSGRPGAKRPFEIATTGSPISLPKGGELVVPVPPLAKDVRGEELRIELNEPKGVSAEIVTSATGQYAVKFTTTPDEVQAGVRGNLLLHVSSRPEMAIRWPTLGKDTSGYYRQNCMNCHTIGGGRFTQRSRLHQPSSAPKGVMGRW
jgi:hypothetical protein